MTAPVVERFGDVAALVAGAAADLAARIERTIAAHGRCRLALAGGFTPKQVYERVARDPSLDWRRVDIFFGDERCVPADHEDSNYRMAREALLDRVAVALTVHRIEGERPPLEAARVYEGVLGDQPLDLVLLGMGEDGHVASLFPDTPELGSAAARVVATRSPRPPAARVSLTLRAINEAGAVVFWVTGAAKADRVAEVFRQIETGAAVLPAAMVAPAGELIWLLDAGAAARLGARSRRPP